MKFHRSRRSMRPGAAGQHGFSMIEVLIALVVLAVGLLGLALLQTTSLRYSKSANQRTQAVNLATELLDTIRANRSQVAAYVAGVNTGIFTPALLTTAQAGCDTQPALTASANITRWSCEVMEALGDEATADVDLDGDEVVVTVTWNDEFWTAASTDGAVVLRSQL